MGRTGSEVKLPTPLAQLMLCGRRRVCRRGAQSLVHPPAHPPSFCLASPCGRARVRPHTTRSFPTCIQESEERYRQVCEDLKRRQRELASTQELLNALTEVALHLRSLWPSP